jgi:hypothetical protein
MEEPGGGKVAPAGAAELSSAANEITSVQAVMARARLLPVAFKFSPPGVWNRLTSAFPE